MNDNAQLSPNASVSAPNLLSKFPKRFILLILLALGNFNMYCVRMCLNVAIVAMTRGEGNQSNSAGPHLSRPRVSLLLFETTSENSPGLQSTISVSDFLFTF